MAAIVPKFAPVRPRVRGCGSDSSRLLEEVVEEYAEESPTGILWLVGQSGAGKTTALSHLAAVFADNPHFAFLDDADHLDGEAVCENHRSLSEEVLVVAARCGASSLEEPLVDLEPWGVDEIVEYLMAAHRSQTGEVMQRLGPTAYQSWMPDIARAVIDQLISNSDLPDATSALLAYLQSELPSASQMLAARQYCLAYLEGGEKALLKNPKLTKSLSPKIRKILCHRSLQVPLAAEQVVISLSAWRSARVLEAQLPWPVVEAVGQTCRSKPEVRVRVEKILSTSRHSRSHAMAASILLAADPTWRPEGKRTGVDFSGGYFAKANWNDVCLAGLPMQLADFREATLVSACFDEAIIVEADFIQADLQKASFAKALAVGASFERGNLRGANFSQAKLESANFVDTDLSEARLWKANLCRADLTRACLRDANLSKAVLVAATLADTDFSHCDLRRVDARRVDLRTAILAGANMQYAWLNGANLEDLEWDCALLSGAGLRGAHLTGSKFQWANLTKADLSGAGLGEIDWEYADLRDANLAGATFHMGSSRSGLVDSPLASEGTRTGFYTDELEELYFKTPEEVRKANLRGADLRGADLTNVDFYLVDLRGSKLDSWQREQAARTGAILSR